jgi:imidazoleglycerol-phosphate dehydratase
MSAAEPVAVAPRVGRVDRATKETSIRVQVNLDGTGATEVDTGVGFFDHMLEQLGRHSKIDLTVAAAGDLHVDAHHTVEDVGIALGTALAQALGDKAGIRRYGWAAVPMEEALVLVAADLSGRPLLAYEAPVPTERIGSYDADLTEEFFTALARTGGITLHVRLLAGRSPHHIVEGVFKAVAKALAIAIEIDPRAAGAIPSTKGVL